MANDTNNQSGQPVFMSKIKEKNSSTTMNTTKETIKIISTFYTVLIITPDRVN